MQPPSYADLVSRLEAVESAQYEGAVQFNVNCGSAQPCCRNPSSTRSGVYLMYESVWATPFFSHNEAYLVLDAIPNISEDVQIVEFGSNLEYSPRIELGYIIPCTGLGWRARYWNFDTNNSVRVADPFPAAGRIEVGLHDDPDIVVQTADDESLWATHTLQLDVVDLEMMMRRGLPDGELTVSGGLRYLRTDQYYQADFTNNGTGVIDDTVTSRHFFEGVGPTLALEGVRRLGVQGWSLFGNVRSSFVFGDSGLEQASIDPQNIAAPIGDFVTASNDLDFQFIGELQLGMQYECNLSNGMLFFTRLAAEAQYWPSGGSGAYQNGEDTDGHGNDPRDADMGFLGISAAVGTNW